MTTLTALIIALILLANMNTPVKASQGYGSYARQMFASLPKGAKFRPDLEKYLSDLAASYRKQAGLRPVRHSNMVAIAARAQAAEMVLGNFVGHHSRAGYSFRERLTAYIGNRYIYSGENAARDRLPGRADRKKAYRLFKLWANSPGHRANLLRQRFAYVSTGVVQKGNHLYAVQIFWQR